MVTTTLEQEQFRVLEDVGQVEICVSKDLETARGFNVSVQTQARTAIGTQPNTGSLVARSTCSLVFGS